MPAAREPPFQFHLRHALIAAAVLCALLAIGTQVGIGVAVAIAGNGVFMVFAWRNGWQGLAVLAPVLSLMGGMSMTALQSPREASPKARCSSNLRNFGSALRQYHADFGCFPPAYVPDENGQPMHSWRVLLLPQLGHSDLTDNIDPSTSWQTYRKETLSNVELPEQTCPCESSFPEETSYLAVVGPGFAWQGAACTKLSDFKDGPENTILLVEVADSGILWMEPRDLHVSQMTLVLNAARGQGPSSRHKGGVNVLFADGHVEFLPNDTPPESLRAMLTIAAGDSP